MLGRYVRKHVVMIYPYVRFFVRAEVHPNFVTLFSLLPACAAAFCIIKGWYWGGGVMVLLAQAFDLVDGAWARMTSKTTKFGDYLDAMADRLRESIFYIGFGLAGYPLEALLALSGSLLISFAKARTALCVPIEDEDWPAVGDMADRSVILVIGLMVAAVKPVWFSKYSSISIMLFVIGLLTYIGFFYRILYAKRIIEKVHNQ